MGASRKWILLGLAALVIVIVILLVWYLYGGEKSTSLGSSAGGSTGGSVGGSSGQPGSQPADPASQSSGSGSGAAPGYLQGKGTPSVVPSGLTYTVWTSGTGGAPIVVTPAGAGATRGGTGGKSTVFLTKSSSGAAANCLNYDNTDWGPLDSGPGMWVANGCAGIFSVDSQPTQCGVKGQTGRYECPPGTMTVGWTA